MLRVSLFSEMSLSPVMYPPPSASVSAFSSARDDALTMSDSYASSRPAMLIVFSLAASFRP